MKKNSFWEHWRYKYRISIMNEDTFTEAWHAHWSRMSVFVLLVVFFVVIVALYSLLIFYTPIRNILPGYSESVRQSLIEESVRVDSLMTSLDAQTRYLDMVRDVMAGEAKSDTIQSLDSMQLVMRTELLQAKNQATADFMAQYEEKEHDNLQLFDVPYSIPTVTFFRPAHGVILVKYAPENNRFGVDIQVPKNENVTSVLSGAVIYCHYEIDNTYTLMVQHDQYISIYGHLGKTLKRIGDKVGSGETIALASENYPFHFELWKEGESINPEEVIAF